MHELVLKHSTNQIRLCLQKDGRGEKEEFTDFNFEILDQDQHLIKWYFEEYLHYPYGLFVDRANRAETVLEETGNRLFQAVFNDRTLKLYDKITDELDRCHIKIEADNAAGWMLPWELLRDPDTGIWLARKAASFLRSHPQTLIEPAHIPENLPTLNILMVIARPMGDQDVPFQSVARPLLEVFRNHRDRINLEILRPPTFSHLARVLRDQKDKYHILHFDGHGSFIGVSPHSPYFYAAGANEGLLVFEDENETGERLVSGTELGQLLKETGVPVVLLNACRSGMTSANAPYGSVAQQLLDAGAQGAVAMGFSVYVNTAVRFMTDLYEGLVNGKSLAEAVLAGRTQLWTSPMRPSLRGNVEMHDWPVPVLFEAAPVKPLIQSDETIHLDATAFSGEQKKMESEIDLPEEPDYGFIGRDSLILELERAFRKINIVLLQGLAGEGKTTAATGFARWLAETGGLKWPAFFFQFTTYLPLAQVCDRIAAVFTPILKQNGIEYHLLESEERRKLVLDLLHQIPCLLIWDNFEPVNGFPAGSKSDWSTSEQQELRQFLHDLRNAATKVLITSRRDESWLGAIYKPVITQGLNRQESRELAQKVLYRAGSRLPGVDFDKEAEAPYENLLKFLHGNPLAIQLVMKELAKGTNPKQLLTDLTTDDADQGREHSLTAALYYGLDKLDPTLRKRLSVLALFQGFVSIFALQMMCSNDDFPPEFKNRDANAWRKDLNAAAEIGILRQIGEGLYTIHPALPWFFNQTLHQAFGNDRDTLESAYCRTYGLISGQLFNLFTTNTQTAITALRLEESNIRHALQLARQKALWGYINNILHGLKILLETQGRMSELKRLLDDLEKEITDDQGKPLPLREQLWITIQGQQAAIAQFQHDFDRAESIRLLLKNYYENKAGLRWKEKASEELTKEELRALKNVEVELHQLGIIAQERGNLEAAEKWYHKSLEIAERICDEAHQARTLHQLGRIAEECGEWVKAEKWYRKSLKIAERIGDENGQAMTFGQLGNLSLRFNDFEKAENYYKDCLNIFERIGAENGQAFTLHQLGVIATECGEWEEAEKWYRKSLNITERIGNESMQARTQHQLGIIVQKHGEWGEAENWYRKSMEIAERIGNESGQASTLHQLGKIAEERGEWGEAEQFYLKSEAIYKRYTMPRELEIVQNSLKRVREKIMG